MGIIGESNIRSTANYKSKMTGQGIIGIGQSSRDRPHVRYFAISTICPRFREIDCMSEISRDRPHVRDFDSTGTGTRNSYRINKTINTKTNS
jgi:hypothetical protein